MNKKKDLKRKSRFLYLHPEANKGKIIALEALQEAYTTYLKLCIEFMLSCHRSSVSLGEMLEYWCTNIKI